MTIDVSGKWWVGDHAEDIAEYLVALKPEGYPVHKVQMCHCDCGSAAFRLKADRSEGAAMRICAVCGTEHLICDSAELWEEAEPEDWICANCGSNTCNIGAGFSFYPAKWFRQPDVRWLSLGQRCESCGVLGMFVDWKVGYGSSKSVPSKV